MYDTSPVIHRLIAGATAFLLPAIVVAQMAPVTPVTPVAPTTTSPPTLLVQSGEFPTRDAILAPGVRVGEASVIADLDGDGRADQLLVVGRGEALSDELALVIALHRRTGWSGEQVAVSHERDVVRWLSPLVVDGHVLLITEEDLEDPDCHDRDEAHHHCQHSTLRYTIRALGPTGRSEVRYTSPTSGTDGTCDFVVGANGALTQRTLRGVSHHEAHGGATVTYEPAQYRTLVASTPGGPLVPGAWARVIPVDAGSDTITLGGASTHGGH